MLGADDGEELALVPEPPVQREGVPALEPRPDGERAFTVLIGEHVDDDPIGSFRSGVADRREPAGHVR